MRIDIVADRFTARLREQLSSIIALTERAAQKIPGHLAPEPRLYGRTGLELGALLVDDFRRGQQSRLEFATMAQRALSGDSAAADELAARDACDSRLARHVSRTWPTENVASGPMLAELRQFAEVYGRWNSINHSVDAAMKTLVDRVLTTEPPRDATEANAHAVLHVVASIPLSAYHSPADKAAWQRATDAVARCHAIRRSRFAAAG